jgi:hypothetical protein
MINIASSLEQMCIVLNIIYGLEERDHGLTCLVELFLDWQYVNGLDDELYGISRLELHTLY